MNNTISIAAQAELERLRKRVIELESVTPSADLQAAATLERAKAIVATFRSKPTPRVECYLCLEPWHEDHHHDASDSDDEILMYGPRTVTTISWDKEEWARLIAQALATLEAATIERCAKAIPTTWLDPLLSGPQSVIPWNGPWGQPVIERLLAALTVRLRALQPEAGT